MTYTFKLSRRLAVSRDLAALGTALLFVTACVDDSTAPPDNIPTGSSTPSALKVSPRRVVVETNQPVKFQGNILTQAGDTVSSAVTWEAYGGTISSDGTYLSSKPGTYKVVGRGVGRGRGHRDTSVVIVVPPQPSLVAIQVSPDPAQLTTGTSQTFTATGVLSDSTTVAVGVNWSATGGQVDAGGVYTAGTTAGSYRITAMSTDATIADTAAISLTQLAPKLAQVVVTPSSASLDAGTTQRFAAYGRSTTGDSMGVSATFSATGGTITSGGLYTAGSTGGTFRVIARASDFADTASVSIVAAPEPPPPSGAVGIPFGPFSLFYSGYNPTNVRAPFTATLNAMSPSSIVSSIAAARKANIHLVLAMTGGSYTKYITNEKFDLTKWKAIQGAFNTATIRTAVADGVADGTIISASVMDEPNSTKWGGVMTKPLLDEMSRYVKTIFPTLKTAVVVYISWKTGEAYASMDQVVRQFSYDKSPFDPAKFRDTVITLAAKEKTGIVFSMNILDGGSRIDGCPKPQTDGPGTFFPNCRMTPAQVENAAKVLTERGACGMLMWRSDEKYLADANQMSAASRAAAVLATRSQTRCARP